MTLDSVPDDRREVRRCDFDRGHTRASTSCVDDMNVVETGAQVRRSERIRRMVDDGL